MTTSVSAAADIGELSKTRVRFHRYGEKQGLPASSVRCIYQDRLGFLWFGTYIGLHRFDGEQVVTFSHDQGDDRSLSSDEVKVIFEDSRGRLWIGTSGGGLNLFDREHRRFTSYRADPQTPDSLAGDWIQAIHESVDGRLWVGTSDNGLCTLREDDGGFDCYRHDENDPTSISSDEVAGIAEAENGGLWVATYEAGLNRLDPATGKFERLQGFPGDSAGAAPIRINAIAADRFGELWVCTYASGLFRFDAEGQLIGRYGPDSNNPSSLKSRAVKAVLDHSSGELWVATWGWGVAAFDRASGAFRTFNHDPDDLWSVSDDRVLDLIEDNLGQIWVATTDGLSVHDPKSRAFGLLRHDPGNTNSLAGNDIQSILEDDEGRVWIGTYNRGLSRWEPESGDFTNFINVPGDPTSLANNGVWAIEQDADGEIWIGTSKGLHRFVSDQQGFVRYQEDPSDPAPFSGNNIISIESDRRGNLWLGTWDRGLNRFDPVTGECEHWLNDPADPESFPEGGIWAIHEDRDGWIWIAGPGEGLVRLDPASRAMERFVHDPEDEASLSHDHLRSLYEDGDGNLWIGTERGLDRWRDGELSRFLVANDLRLVEAIAGGGPGVLWFAIEGGIGRLDISSRQVEWFDVDDGLQGNRFAAGAVHKGANGTLYFGGSGGITFFDPADVVGNFQVPNVVLTEFLLRNRPVAPEEGSVLEADIAWTDRIELSHRDYSFSFDFAALNLRQPKKNRYMHRLRGIDPEWVPTDPNYRRVTYTGVRPGTYTFQVKASNDDSVWNQDGASVVVRVRGPWWQWWWIRAILVLVVGVSVLGGFRLRVGALERRNLLLSDLVAERTAELEESNRKLEDASVTDPLTGLRNRRFLLQHIEGDVAKSLRDQQDTGRNDTALIFILIDLDNFKAINDTYGHDAGDSVLKQFADALSRICRGSDFVVRWGGEEFLVVARFIDRQRAFDASERIRESVADTHFGLGDGRELRTTCSIGVACFPFVDDGEDQLTWEQVLAAADRGLYVAKVGGRNATVLVSATDTTVAAEVVDRLDEDFDGLLRDGQLRMTTSSSVSG